MNRRHLLVICMLGISQLAEGAIMNRRFVFRIKTKGGSIVGNVVIEAKDIEAAKVKLFKRYPDCQILNVETK
jgi:hypothetical protein